MVSDDRKKMQFASGQIHESTSAVGNIKPPQEEVRDEIVFLVEQEADGTYTAHSKDYTIFTFGDSVDSLKNNIKDAMSCHFDDHESDKKTYKLQFTK